MALCSPNIEAMSSLHTNADRKHSSSSRNVHYPSDSSSLTNRGRAGHGRPLIKATYIAVYPRIISAWWL